MLIGQQLGPFRVEKEIGAGAMGAVYLARLAPPGPDAAPTIQKLARVLKSGQQVAIKVMAPGMGTTNPTAIKRFERESAILKQMKHPHIVRVYAIGKEKGTRYYAMELIDGESLDRILERRGRLSWEETVTLAKQLCDALQHAHEQGIIHRDLKPSNLMILRDGTLKLTDFGIAKDLDETALTSANCTVGTAAYMSPEQCRGVRDLTPRCDLYSLGIVLYELVTGAKPYHAENAMEMFMQHVQGTFVRPSQRALDVPIWLDTLICQLMEKSPDQRPRDAATVGKALDEIQQKVEAHQSAGVDVARSRVVDRPRGQRPTEAEDKSAALSLLGIKVRGKRKKKKPFYEKVWFRAAGLLLLLAGVVTALFLALRPPSPERLYQRAAKLMASSRSEDHEEAWKGPIQEYLKRYEMLADERTQQIKKWADAYELDQCEEKVQTHLRKGDKYPGSDSLEKQAFSAAEKEQEGNLDSARGGWTSLARAGSHRWELVAEHHLHQLHEVEQHKAHLNELLAVIEKQGRIPSLSDPSEASAFLATRYEQMGDLPRARKRFRELRDQLADDSAQRVWYLFAAGKVQELNRHLEDNRFQEEEWEKRIQEMLKKATDQLGQPEMQRKAKGVCLDLLELYGQSKDDSKLKPLLDQARALLREACSRLGEPPPA